MNTFDDVGYLAEVGKERLQKWPRRRYSLALYVGLV